jgi:hypothetical protein
MDILYEKLKNFPENIKFIFKIEIIKYTLLLNLNY